MEIEAMSAIWKTLDGRELEVTWMSSKHLINALNNLYRKLTHNCEEEKLGAIRRTALYEETISRQLVVFDFQKEEFLRPKQDRETLIEMCMLRAIIDTGNKDYLKDWNVDKKKAFVEIEMFAKVGSPYAKQVLAKFAEYRLKRS
jgi:hypothetical protein